jgi:hypothetical protein
MAESRMRYDFDMVYVIPESLRTGDLDHGPGSLSEQVALWRDPEVAKSLQRADPEVQDLFRDSGFGLTTHQSDLEPDTYPAMDDDARLMAVNLLAENLHDLGPASKRMDWGGFDLDEFLDHLDRAVPIGSISTAKGLKKAPTSLATQLAPLRNAFMSRVAPHLFVAVVFFLLINYGLQAVGIGDGGMTTFLRVLVGDFDAATSDF